MKTWVVSNSLAFLNQQFQISATSENDQNEGNRNDSQVFEGLAKAMFTPQQLGRRLASKSQSPLQKWKENVPNLVVKRIYLGLSFCFSICFAFFVLVFLFSSPVLSILLRWEDFGMDDNMANREMPGRSNGYYRRLTQFTAKNRRNVKNTMICSVQKEGSAVYQILSDMNMGFMFLLEIGHRFIFTI